MPFPPPRRGAALVLPLVLGALVLATACGTGRPPPPEGVDVDDVPLPTREPFVRVGVEVGAEELAAEAPGGMRVVDLATGEVLSSGAEDRLRFRAAGGAVTVASDPSPEAALGAGRPEGRVGGAPGDGGEGKGFRRLRLTSRDGRGVAVQGRSYRGAVDLYVVGGHGLVAVNQLPLEQYLLGTVPVEIGPREPKEMEAVKAQAVAARTYAVRNLGRRDSLGFDLFGNVEDQVYGGRAVEREEVTRAVRDTEGEVLTYRGRPIRAYYHSTGGGRTARVTDVWNLPDAPYLQRTSDARPGGEEGDFCDVSPRYGWEERWSPEELRIAVEEGLQDYFGTTTAVDRVEGVEVLERTEGGRVSALEVRTSGGRWVVEKDDIRFFLRTPDGRGLRSTWFRVDDTADGGLRMEGRGFGHGVGMCQWGAIGRSREGQGYREILAHYYPGTELRRAYRVTTRDR